MVEEAEVIRYVAIIADSIEKRKDETFSDFVKRMRNYYAKKVGHNSVTIIVP